MTKKQTLRKGRTSREAPAHDGWFRPALLSQTIKRVCLYSAGALVGQTVLSGSALAAPQGGQIVGGSGVIHQHGNVTEIHQNGNSLAIDWQSFNISRKESVDFQQPSSSAAVLNRIFDQNPSQILGTMTSNGRVFLLNSNGIIFGENASVNVGSLVAGTLDMSVRDFMGGRYNLNALAGKDGVVINRGLIQAATGGSVTLVGGAVVNEGIIVADYGQVNLAAGRKATLDFDGDGLIRFEVSEKVLENAAGLQDAVLNSGTIQAQGGKVLLTASAARDVFTNVVNNSGVIRAGRINNQGGVVRLVGAGGNTIHSGSIDVSGQDAVSTGGEVHVLGDNVGLLGDASIDASGATGGGTVLVGGDFQGKNPDIKNAVRTYVNAGATINADATGAGDGGKVIVWADDVTGYFGRISAKGGTSGDGGFAEVSGKEQLLYKGSADLTAVNGSMGTLLLDPATITIDAVGTDNAEISDQTILAGDAICGGSCSISAAEINTQMNMAAVSLAASTNVDVTVAVPISGGPTSGKSLTLDAPTINFSDGANITTNDGNLTLTGDVRLNDGATVSLSTGAGAGDILVNGTGTIDGNAGVGLENVSLDSGTGTITVTGAVGSNLETLTVTQSGGTTFQSTVDAANVTLTDTTGAITFSGNLTATTLSAAAQGYSVVLNGTATTITNDVTFGNTGGVTLGNGNGDVLTFNGGLDTTAGATTAQGLVRASGDQMDIGALTITGGGAGALTLDTTNNGGTPAGAVLNVGAVTSGGSQLNVSVGAGNDVNLNNGANDLATVSVMSGNNVAVVDTNAIDLGASTVSGDLAVTAPSGITNSGALSVAGNSTFTANTLGSSILLGNAGNVFTGTVAFASTGGLANVTVVDTTALDLQALTLTGNLSATGAGLTQSGVLDINGTSTFNGGANAITLTNADNDFTGAVSLNNSGANNVAVTDTNAIDLGASSVGGNLTVTAGGAITDSGSISAAALTTTSDGGTVLDAGHSVSQFTATNTTSGNITFTNTGTLAVAATNAAGDVTITNNGDVLLGLVSASGNTVNITASGSGADILNNNGSTNVQSSIVNLTANSRIGSSASEPITLDIDVSGEVNLKFSAAEAFIKNLHQTAVTVTGGGSVVDLVGSAIAGAGKAQDTELASVGFVDWSLFSEDLSLFGVVEPGIKLPKDQIEDDLVLKMPEPDVPLLLKTARGWEFLWAYQRTALGEAAQPGMPLRPKSF